MDDDSRRTLVLGGARSGKSRHAEALAATAGRRVYIATAQAFDDEMRDRIDRHRTQRGDGWSLVEEPLELTDAIARVAAPGTAILVDCLTLWLSNLLLAGRDLDAASNALVAALPALPGRIILVSNEVGFGIVPDNALARRFRDAAGLLNQAVAAACQHVILVTAGLPLTLKQP